MKPLHLLPALALLTASCTTRFPSAGHKVPVSELLQLAGDYTPDSTPREGSGSASLANFLWPASKASYQVKRVRFSVPRPGVLRCEGFLPGSSQTLVREHVLGKDAALKDGGLHWDLKESRPESGFSPGWGTAAIQTSHREFLLLENRDLCMRSSGGAYGMVILIPIASKEVSEYRYQRLK